jgi:NADPH:quinone reductase-like Zn-dependent oxidoreductase
LHSNNDNTTEAPPDRLSAFAFGTRCQVGNRTVLALAFAFRRKGLTAMIDKVLEVHVPRHGPAEVLQPLERTLPPPQSGEVRVKIEAAGVAYADIVMRRGLYPGARAPITPGYDFVGKIEALGESVTGYSVGQRVGALTVSGSYASHRNVDARWLVPAPEGIDAIKLVAVTLNGLTAWQMFHRLGAIDSEEWVLVHGAAGGVGTLLLDVAALAGVRAIGTASSGKRDQVTSRGGLHVDYAAEDVVSSVKRISEGGVVAAFDHIGGRHFRKVSMGTLRPGGTAILYGGYDATRDGKLRPGAMLDLYLNSRLSSFDLFNKSQGAIGYNVTSWRDNRTSVYRRDLAHLYELVAQGKIDPLIAATFALRDAAKAQKALETRSVAGKIVLLP